MKVIGIMSGTSMDGADRALCDVHFDGVKWQTSWKNYKTFNTAKKAAEKYVAQISNGWTKFPTWTITEHN